MAKWQLNAMIKKMTAQIGNVDNVLDRSLCAQHIAMSCLNYLMLGRENNFYSNIYSEFYRATTYSESWDAVCIIRDTLNLWGLSVDQLDAGLWGLSSTGIVRRPKKRLRTTLVRDMVFCEIIESFLTWPDILATRNDEKPDVHDPQRFHEWASICDVLAFVTGKTYYVIKRAWYSYGPTCEWDPAYDMYRSQFRQDRPSCSRIGIAFDPRKFPIEFQSRGLKVRPLYFPGGLFRK